MDIESRLRPHHLCLPLLLLHILPLFISFEISLSAFLIFTHSPSLSLSLSLSLFAHQVVFVVSGKELYAVSEFFGDVKGLGLGAEHGFYYKWPALRDESLIGLATESGETQLFSPSKSGI